MAESNERAGVVALIFSFIFPIVGFVIYFVNRKKVENPSAYLTAAVIGVFFNIFIRRMIISMA